MSVQDAIDELAKLEEEISVEHPKTSAIVKTAKVWRGMPPSSIVITDFPTFQHTWTRQALPVERGRLPNGVREQHFTIRIQCIIAPLDPEADVNMELAAAFDQAIADALETSIQLGNPSWLLQNFRGGDPTLVKIYDEFLGLDYLYDFLVRDQVARSS